MSAQTHAIPFRAASATRLLAPAGVCFLLALGARLLVLWKVTGTADFLPESGDMRFYSDWARRIAAGKWTDGQAFYGLPGYAYLLAGVYRLCGFQPFLMLFVQAVADAGTAAVIFGLGQTAFKETISPRGARAIGASAALGWVCFQPAQTFSNLLMPTVLLILAFWWTVRQCLRWREEGSAGPRPAACFGLGTMVGITAMGVANILFLVPMALAAIVLPRAGIATADRRRSAVGAALLLIGVVAGTAPCWLHNYFVAGEPVFLSAHGGINFFIGNGPGANGYPKLPAGLRADQEGMLADSVHWAERAAGRSLRRSEVSAYWSARARESIVADPVAWARLLAVKVRNFWSAFPYDDLSMVTQFREEGVLLPGFGFGIAAFFGLPGLAVALWRGGRARWVAAAVLLHMVSLLTVFITERYRMAAAPGLLLLGAYGMWTAVRWLQAGRTRPALFYAVALTCAGVFVFWPQSSLELRTLDDYNTALADMRAERFDRAQAKLERVEATRPDNAENLFALGNLWLARGDHARAKEYYRRVLKLAPGHGGVLNNLGVLAMQENRWPLAERFLLYSLQSDGKRGDAKTHYLLAKVRYAQRDFIGAEEAIQFALQAQPHQAEFEAFRNQLHQVIENP